MVKTLADLVERYKLNTEFFQEHVQHTDGGIAKNKVTMKGYWSSVGELGGEVLVSSVSGFMIL